MTLALALAPLLGMVGSSGLGLAGLAGGYATRLVAAASGAVWLPSSFFLMQEHVALIHDWVRP